MPAEQWTTIGPTVYDGDFAAQALGRSEEALWGDAVEVEVLEVVFARLAVVVVVVVVVLVLVFLADPIE